MRKPPAKGHRAFRRSGVVEGLPIGDWFGQWWTRQWKCLHHTPAERQRWKRESPFCPLPFCPFGPEGSATCSPVASLRWAAVSPPTRPPRPLSLLHRACTFFNTSSQRPVGRGAAFWGVDCPATGTSSHFRATQVPSHRIANCPSTSVCLIHDLDRDPTPPGHAKISRRQRHPDRRAAPLVVPGRPQLQPNSRPSAAFGGAGALVPGLVRRWKWTVDSRQGSLSQTKKKIGEVQLSEIRTAAALPALHPPPGPTDAAPAIAKSEQRPRLRPPSPSPSSASPRASAAAKLLSPVVASRPSPVARHSPVSLASHTLLHAPATPSPPLDCAPPSESIEPATRHHPASSPTPSTIATNRDPDHPSAP